MPIQRTPESASKLAANFKPISKMTVDELRSELASLDQPTTGNKATLLDRLKKACDYKPTSDTNLDASPAILPRPSLLEHSTTASTSPSTLSQQPTDLMMLFTLMKQQEETAERRFQLQQEAAQKRFQAQLEEIREHAKAERYQLTEFLSDVHKKEKQSSHSGDSNRPAIIGKRFKRMYDELSDSLQALEIKYTSSKSIEEIEVYVKTVELAMTDLKSYVDSKIDYLDDGAEKTEILESLKESSGIYFSSIPLAKAKLNKLKSEEEADKLAGSLPNGVSPPSFYGDILAFPVFWESFEPLVHKNPKVSKFYKMTYLKTAMKGSASGALNGFPSTSSNYEPAVEAILKRYGRTQAIVRSHVKDLLEGKQAELKLDSMRALYNRANAKKSILTQHGIGWDQIFTQILEAQLPTTLYERWMRKISPLMESNDVASSDQLLGFIATELATMESLKKPNSKPAADKAEKSPKQRFGNREAQKEQQFSAQSLVTQSDPPTSCVYCSKEHSLKNCEKFIKLTPTQRMANLISKPGKICFRCLAPKGESGHPRNFYQCKARCAVEDCGKPHHELIHVAEKDDHKTLVSTTAPPDHPSKNSRDHEIDTILPTALAQITHLGRTRRVRVAFDSLSEKSFITSDAVRELALPSIHQERLNITGFGGISHSRVTDVVQFNLSSLTSTESMNIQAHVQDGVICTPLKDTILRPEQVSHLHGLQLADPYPREDDGAVDILLGGRYYFSLMRGKMISPDIPELGPFGIDTIFGWVLAGPFRDPQRVVNQSNCLLVEATRDPWRILDEKLERFWRQDAIGLVDKRDVYTAEELDALNHFDRSVSYDGLKYSVLLPFREYPHNLKPNYREAYSRLLAAERALRKNPDRLRDYDTAIMEYDKSGFSRRLTSDEFEGIKDLPHYFIPHHPVFKKSSSTQLRVVFDASARNCEGKSLNDCLLKGPNLLPDIVLVLLRFRTFKIALSGDIRKMFCQTEIAPEHQRYQLYLWRNCDDSRPPDIYVMMRIMFGVTSSPFLAIQSIRHHARELPKEDSDIRNIILNNTYVDDVHLGGDNVEQVLKQQRKLVEFFGSGGWTLVKSNSPELMQHIPEDARLSNFVLDLDNDNYGEATSLGLKWNTVEDVLYCNVKSKLCEQVKIVTKRTMLSKISQIYDVFGFFAAFVVKAKIMLQDLWKQKLDWDEPVNETTEIKFRKWTDELSLLSSIKIPRYLFTQLNSVSNIQLHGFADASESAYGAVVYVRAEDNQGTVHINYLISKTRVAPLKAISVARLELMAAHCLSKLINYIMDGLNPALTVDKIHLWLDSEIALAWIAKPSSHWKTFVRNRVQEIHDLVSPDSWRHCPGHENPADLHSRGVALEELKSSELYWFGPPWLSLKECCWPNKVPIVENSNRDSLLKEAVNTTVLVVLENPNEVPFFEDRYNDYTKIVRITARILRWRKRDFAKFDPECDGRLIGPNEFRSVEEHLWRLLQRSAFEQDYTDLEDGKVASRKCPFIGMDPQFDQERKLIVAGNRLQMSELPDSAKHPIILPPKSPLVEKFILHIHLRNSHAPQDTTIAIIRESFFIIHIRNEVKKALRKCIVCRHWRTKPLAQKMGILPAERIRAAPAFSEVGLDFTGPIHIDTGGDDMQKAYICLFTCPHSRMVHFELTNNMSTEEFLAALRRMMNRRGWCREIISDNQTTFKKAEKVIGLSIRAQFKGRSKDETLQKFLTDNCIVWKYITERAPHRGAFYERMNRSLKEPLRKILGKAKLTYVELYTLLTDIECALNQRPLTYLGSDPRNPQAITPAHLTLGRPLQQLPYLPSSANVTKRYRYLQTLLKQFWTRWSKEYLPSLLRRNKWTIPQTPPKIGDDCLISEDGRARPTWLMGRIIDALPSKDGLIRTFKLKTSKGVLNRPIQRLHLLEETD